MQLNTSFHPMATADFIQGLFEEHQRMILASAFRITGRSEDAEDVLQTVFMRLVRKDDLDIGEHPERYLRRAAINAALDVVRSKRRGGVALENVEYQLSEDESGWPDQLEAASELRQWLRRELGLLGKRAAEVFVLRFIEGLNNQEIAELVGTSPGTIAVTLHRARTQLQSKLGQFLGGRQ